MKRWIVPLSLRWDYEYRSTFDGNETIIVDGPRLEAAALTVDFDSSIVPGFVHGGGVLRKDIEFPVALTPEESAAIATIVNGAVKRSVDFYKVKGDWLKVGDPGGTPTQGVADRCVDPSGLKLPPGRMCPSPTGGMTSPGCCIGHCDADANCLRNNNPHIDWELP